MTPTQEILALAYQDGERDGRDAAAREMAAEIEGLRGDLKAAQAQLARWDAVTTELRKLLHYGQVQFRPGPGPACLILGDHRLQGLGLAELLRALAQVAEGCRP